MTQTDVQNCDTLQAGVADGGRRAVFLDRDGTIIVDCCYLRDPDGVELLPGAAAGLGRMQAMGMALVVVTNQSGVGRGYYDMEAVGRVHDRMVALLAAEGIRLDGIYVCPHAPTEVCDCRKPLPGLVVRACRELGLSPETGFVIGDKACDIELGRVVGATTILVTTGYGAKERDSGRCRPDHVAADLDEAARIIEAALTQIPDGKS